MGTKELEKKTSSSKSSPSRKSSDKSEEKGFEATSARMADQPGDTAAEKALDSSNIFQKVKFEVYGEEMISKEVKQSGNSGRVYLPPDWIGKHLKIIRID